jgi:transposase
VNATERELLEHAPHFNTASKLLNRKDITPILHELIAITARPLQSVDVDFAVDSSGFQTTRFGEYCKHKHGEKKEHGWLKCHIVTGVKTNIITAVEITHNNSGDCPKLPTLMKATAEQGFTINEVTADKAYSSRENYDTVQELGGQAYIPFKKNATGHSHGSPMWKKMFYYFQLHQEEFMQHYHKRSNVETTFFMLKAKFGDYLRSKNPTALENELLCKIICHNICVLIQEMHQKI